MPDYSSYIIIDNQSNVDFSVANKLDHGYWSQPDPVPGNIAASSGEHHIWAQAHNNTKGTEGTITLTTDDTTTITVSFSCSQVKSNKGDISMTSGSKYKLSLEKRYNAGFSSNDDWNDDYKESMPSGHPIGVKCIISNL